MKITPITFLNSINKVSFNKKQNTSAFIKKAEVDSVSFSSNAKKPERYKKDATKGRYLNCCYIVENVKNKDPLKEIEKFDNAADKTTDKANKASSEALSLKDKALSSYNKLKSGMKLRETGVESFSSSKSIRTIKLKTGYNADGSKTNASAAFTDEKLVTVKVSNVFEGASWKDRVYHFDPENGELVFYEERKKPVDDKKDNTKTEIVFKKDSFDVNKMIYKKGQIAPYAVLGGKIEYDKNGNVSYIEFEQDDKVISKAIDDGKIYLLETQDNGENRILDCEFYNF